MTFKCVFLTHLLLLWVGSESGASEAAGRSARDSTTDALVPTDALSQHMYKLYEKYDTEPNRLKEGNTVRSFKAKPGKYVKKTKHYE